MNINSKGSEWRKWDLHVHTPESELNNGFGSNWDIYVKNLFTKAIENEIVAIGITDYFTIDGYKKLRNEYLDNEQKLQQLFTADEISRIKAILILPNIEFRLDKFVDVNRINFHVIFSDKVSIQDIEENFLHELNFVYEGNPQEDDEKRKLKINNLISLGAKLKRDHAKFRKDSDLFTGMMNAVVSDEEIVRILREKRSIFKSNYLLALPADEDLSKVGWDNQAHNTRKVLIQKSDCIFSSNSKTRKWALGKFGGVEDYINEFKTLKPCVWGSDAHNFEELFTKNADRLLWVKADPTFEGLRQILYEPGERVEIADRKPDQKRIYEVIDKVRFLDPNFTSEYIEINENLTTIIGGKSTGKSTLLKSIAKTSDQKEFFKRNKSAGILEKRPVKGFEVIWKDGQISKLGAENNPTKKIIYIPQSYLNRIVDEIEKTTDIDEIIQDVLLQKDGFRNWHDSLETRKKDISDKIELGIKSLFESIDTNIRKNEEKKKLGDEEGFKKQIEKLTLEIKGLQEKSTVSEGDLKLFNTTDLEIKQKRSDIERMDKDILRLNKLNDISVDTQEFIIQEIIDPLLREELLRLSAQKKEEYKIDWKKSVKVKVDLMENKRRNLVLEIEVQEKSISYLREALKEQNSLNDLMKEKEKEEETLAIIRGLNNAVGSSYLQIQESINLLADLNSQYYSLYLEAKDMVDLSGFDEELSFDIRTTFTSEKFQQSFVNKCFDGRATRGREYDYLTSYSFENPEEHKKFLKEQVWKIIRVEMPMREGIDNKEAVTSLFKNWFVHDYKVSYQGDSLSEMSPGKKSFVLLRLLIDLDDSQWPILIDQPEDDLDNRSIYKQVVKFLRKRKKNRQIIIVTHNPNLVLGADAEAIVVANQEGEDTKNKSHKFEYVSGSIENSAPEDDTITEILYRRGIQEHICDVLEGGREAFDKRKKKYNF